MQSLTPEVPMNGLDFKKIVTAKQETLLEEILVVCEYFYLSRNWKIQDATYAEQAIGLGLKFQQLQRTVEESKN